MRLAPITALADTGCVTREITSDFAIFDSIGEGVPIGDGHAGVAVTDELPEAAVSSFLVKGNVTSRKGRISLVP